MKKYGIFNGVSLLPAAVGELSAWSICQDCAHPFEIPTGFWFVMSSDWPADELRVIGGPCPRCWDLGREARGWVLAGRHSTDDGDHVVAGAQSSLALAMLVVSRDLQDGRITENEAAQTIREHGTLRRFAEEIEQRPVGANVAGLLLAAIITGGFAVIAADVATDSEPDQEQVDRIVDRIVDEYRETGRIQLPPPAAVAKLGSARKFELE